MKLSTYSSALAVVFLCASMSLPAQTVVLTNVAEFSYHRLGEDGCQKVCAVLEKNNIGCYSVEFASVTLSVPPDQAPLARKLLKELVSKDKLKIHVIEEGDKAGRVGVKF